MPEFAHVAEWELEEYVDGSLLRVFWNPQTGTVRFRGEDETTFIPEKVLSDLMGLFTHKALKKALNVKQCTDSEIEIFLRIPIVKDEYIFTLVDVFCGGLWLQREAVRIVAAKLRVNTPGYMGHRSTSDMIDYLSTRPMSFIRNAIVRKVVGRCRDKDREIIMKFAYKDQR